MTFRVEDRVKVNNRYPIVAYDGKIGRIISLSGYIRVRFPDGQWHLFLANELDYADGPQLELEFDVTDR